VKNLEVKQGKIPEHVSICKTQLVPFLDYFPHITMSIGLLALVKETKE
jgi:hypothetical protein